MERRMNFAEIGHFIMITSLLLYCIAGGEAELKWANIFLQNYRVIPFSIVKTRRQ